MGEALVTVINKKKSVVKKENFSLCQQIGTSSFHYIIQGYLFVLNTLPCAHVRTHAQPVCVSLFLSLSLSVFAWIHKYVTKTVDCGISHKYRKYIEFIQCKILQIFYETVLWIIFTHKKFVYRLKGMHIVVFS